MKLLLSIIIPIYNTPCEKLQRCFASVQGIQTNTYECILVDDGSCKEIGQYAKKYASTSETFKYFRKENGGVSSARNVGIEAAAGEYIYFVDSDDAIEPQIFDVFLSGNHSEDICFTDLLCINGEKKSCWKVLDTRKITYEKLALRLFRDGGINGPCCKFIKKSFLYQYGIRFQEEMVTAEDRMFLIDMLLCDPSVAYLDEVSYYYYREVQTGIERVGKYSTVFLYNNKDVYRKEKILAGKIRNSTEIKKINVWLADRFCKDIFDIVLEMTEAGIRPQDVEQDIENVISFADMNDASIKTRIRQELLLRKHWKMLRLLAVIRRKYLRARGLH